MTDTAPPDPMDLRSYGVEDDPSWITTELLEGMVKAHPVMLVRELAARVLKAECSFSEGIEDTKRLDWLDLHHVDLSIHRDLSPDMKIVYVDCAVTGTMAYGETLRAAIDAAIAKHPAGATPASDARDMREAEGTGHAPASAGPDACVEQSAITSVQRSGNFCSCVYKCGDAPGWEDKACSQPHGLLLPDPFSPKKYRCLVAENGLDDRCAPGDCPTPDECLGVGGNKVGG